MIKFLKFINNKTLKIDIRIYFYIKVYFFSIFSYDKYNFYTNFFKYKKLSRSQIFQDILAITLNGNLKKNYFVEFGAGDGKKFSNTYLLEKFYGWKGLLVEPAISLHKQLSKNRKVQISRFLLDNVDNKRKIFYETSDPYLSSIKKMKLNSSKYLVRTITLNSLLKKYNSPKKINYISIDTEGNEYEILKNFNFKKYKVRLFTIEHNFNSKKRKKIYHLMKKNSYTRIFKHLSYMDDWYFKDNF